MTVKTKAPAKINLHLDILERRADGYHNLLSIFQSVDLFDTLIINMKKKGSGCIIKGGFPFPQGENIVKKAVELFEKAGRKELDMEIHIKKRIPFGAGLGGGSSDAAATVSCLYTLFPGVVAEEKIQEILEDLGSDVPYFYYTAAALVSGRGEIIKPLIPRTDYHLVVVYPGFQVDTSLAYQWLDKEREGGKKEKLPGEDDLITMYRSEEKEKWGFSNSFFRVIINQYPAIYTIISDMYSSGAFYGNISGSGSAVFGLYREKYQAKAGFGCLKRKYPFVFYTNPLDKKPVTVLK
ncbi:MAG: 4-(cytidine 5'-diphospho)-2-C-methyl-D-erythritol kinase [Spirochaetales bacterium]|nr:4-(cytidine 5'-diphospho)-2-C-methyl-D-erythritol kinase [Spirochaetales bacterium]